MQRMLGMVVVLWGVSLGASAAEPRLVFEDQFAGKLGDGWSWLREDPQAWRLKENALEIRIQPGVAATVKNALVRPAPDRRQGRVAITVTVRFLQPPTQQFEQGGITWYHDGKPVFKLVYERIDGETFVIPGRKPMAAESVQLRLIVTANSWTAHYRAGGQGEFETAGSGPLPEPGEDLVSLQCYQGPEDAEHWMRFEHFRIEQLAD